MKNKLPKVFANNIEKEINNNEKIYSSYSEQNKKKKEITENQFTKKNINQKINEIMNSKNYIYKTPVKIKTKNDEITTKIIGKNRQNIITIDNKLIRIDEIIDIEIDDKIK